MDKSPAQTAAPATGRRLRYLLGALILVALVFPGFAHAVVLGTVTVLLTVATANVKVLVLLAAAYLLTRFAPKTSRALLRSTIGPKLALRVVPATV